MSKKLEECSKDELVEIIKHLKKRKKFGLVWEDKSEDVVEQCKQELPVLEEARHLAIKRADGTHTNLLIEGDNYHALSVLNYTHAGKIDVIYIDPPYNTGAKDWKYNNDYVDINDTYRHSKWLSMMGNRLRLAKRLLSSNGILITAIDDNEFATLRLLLGEILPNYNHETIVVNHHPQGSGGDNISMTHEYAIVSTPKGKHLILGQPNQNEFEEWSLIKAGAGSDYQRAGRPRMFFALHIDKNTGKAVGIGPELQLSDQYETGDTAEGYKRIYPIDSKGKERRWRYGREKMLELIEQNLIIASAPSYTAKVVVARKGIFKPVYSNWVDARYNAGTHGTRLLEKIFGDNRFPYPKSLYAVKDIVLAATRLKTNAIVLDYFAGSGTTGQAVLELNREDNGTRQFILCTNNENRIAEDVTYPRIKHVIEGYADVSGIPANLRYFKTSFVPKSTVSDDTRYQLVERSIDMICVREDTYEKIEDNNSYKIFSNQNHYTAILFNVDALESLKEALSKLDDKSVNLYVFSLTSDDYSQDFMDLKQSYKICPIPESILEVYRRIFRSHQWN